MITARAQRARAPTGNDGLRCRHAFTAERGAGSAGHPVCGTALSGFRSDRDYGGFYNPIIYFDYQECLLASQPLCDSLSMASRIAPGSARNVRTLLITRPSKLPAGIRRPLERFLPA